jgi:GTP-binding protein
MKKIPFQQTQFLKSAENCTQLPSDEGAEVAFAGRSNAGKSSALNILCQQKKLARVSKTPGRTQLLNFFVIDETHRLVDLPGYGFAQVPLDIKRRWDKELDCYLRTRESLRGLVLLMDIRHPLKPFDEHMIQWAESTELAVHVLLTKADKLKYGARMNTLKLVEKSISERVNITVQLFSATEQIGREEFQLKMTEWLCEG